MKKGIILFSMIVFVFACQVELEPPSLGQISVSAVTNHSVDISCEVVNNGNSPIDTIGICWSIDKIPTINDSTYELVNSNTINYQISGLIPKSKYYVRAFAINEKGLSYSAESSFVTEPNETETYIDPRDEQEYKIVKIGEQWWFAENLKYVTPDSWIFKDDSLNYASAGRLYSHESTLIAIPEGWKLPSDSDWRKLEKYLGMNENELNETHWRGIGIANYLLENGEYDFNVIWSGKRDTTLAVTYSEISSAYFWSSTSYQEDVANSNEELFYGREFSYGFESIKRRAYPSWLGLSVRCVKK